MQLVGAFVGCGVGVLALDPNMIPVRSSCTPTGGVGSSYDPNWKKVGVQCGPTRVHVSWGACELGCM